MIHSDLPPETGSNPLWITGGTPGPDERRMIHTDLPPETGSKSALITGGA
jgi:hypothetical protein